MDAKEIKAALDEIAASIGPKADLSIFVSNGPHRDKPIYASLHPFGAGTSKGHIGVYGDTFASAIQKMKDEWAKYADEHKRQTVHGLALAIIRLTTDLGECTDAALRAEFDAGSVARWGDEACTLADEMAGRGPFTIKRKRGANAA